VWNPGQIDRFLNEILVVDGFSIRWKAETNLQQDRIQQQQQTSQAAINWPPKHYYRYFTDRTTKNHLTKNFLPTHHPINNITLHTYTHYYIYYYNSLTLYIKNLTSNNSKLKVLPPGITLFKKIKNFSKTEIFASTSYRNHTSLISPEASLRNHTSRTNEWHLPLELHLSPCTFHHKYPSPGLHFTLPTNAPLAELWHCWHTSKVKFRTKVPLSRIILCYLIVKRTSDGVTLKI